MPHDLNKTFEFMDTNSDYNYATQQKLNLYKQMFAYVSDDAMLSKTYAIKF